jgi:hypothetical protein
MAQVEESLPPRCEAPYSSPSMAKTYYIATGIKIVTVYSYQKLDSDVTGLLDLLDQS